MLSRTRSRRGVAPAALFLSLTVVDYGGNYDTVSTTVFLPD